MRVKLKNYKTKRKRQRMIDSAAGAFLSYRIIPSFCFFVCKRFSSKHNFSKPLDPLP